MAAPQRRRWTWHFEQPPERIWPALADTARFNEAAELPKHSIEESPQPDGTVIYTGRAKMGPFALAWQDLPVEWVTNRSFKHCRKFHNGPFASLCATLSLSREGEGCRADYDLEVAPANLLGRLLLATSFFKGAGKTFARLAEEARAYAAGQRDQPFVFKPAALDAAAKARLESIRARLAQEGGDPALVARLLDYVATAPEVDLLHIRPLRLARLWNAPERAVIELCLAAVKAGLLEMHWDLLCPNCRGAKAAIGSLDLLPRGAHCGTCNIDYDRDFDRNVELTLRPAATIRAIPEGEFCLFGPMTTPHVVVQQTLAPGETRELEADLPFGEYRLRGLHPIGEVVANWPAGGFPTVVVDERGVTVGEPAPAGRVRIENRASRALTLVVESRAWVADALTAHRVTTLQAFRDLFSSEVLRPGDQVGVKQVALLFTDIGGSTALYARIGDASAYHLVREHFAFLTAAVRDHDGTIVKTIGDAVMAAFADPAQAVRAALAVQRNLVRFNREHAGAAGGDGIVIKVGVHAGPCIAVTLNERLDYFGSTVNMAARLQDQSRGGDIVLSETLLADPAVAAVLRGLSPRAESATLKGFADPVAFHRLTPEALAQAA